MIPAVIQTIEQVKWMQLKPNDVRQMSKMLKLPASNILRLNDLILYSRLDSIKVQSVRAFRLEMKRRLYIRCMRSHPELFQGRKDELAPEVGSVLGEAYVWNDVMEDD
jgi:hypothetical protein